MKGGLLRHRMFVDEPVTVRNLTGEEVMEWQQRAQLWCSIEPIGGREASRANQIIADLDTRIVTRWSTFAAGITAKWRFRFERNQTAPMIYNIVRPPAERRLSMRELEFSCKSGLNDG